MRYTMLSILLVLTLFSCIEPIDKSYSKLPPGIWRGVLILDNKPTLVDTDEEFSVKTDFSGELPFNFEVIYTSAEDFYIEIHNAEERIAVSDIVYGRDKATAKDTILIDFPVFDTYIKAIYEDDIMEGDWFVNYRNNYQIPFKAYFGQSHRFTTLKKEPIMNISGKWDVTFAEGTEDEYLAIGEFVQKGNEVTGTFMTETGDYRYLEGTIQGKRIYLSTFDASHAFLFEAKILDDNSMIGSFKSGKHYTSTWSATKNDNAQIGDAFSLTTSDIGDEVFDFTFEDLEGNEVSLSDDRFADKIKLVKISGTWCPNCKDESNFIMDYLKNNPSDDIEVIEVAFERYKDINKAKEVLKRYSEKMQLPFTVLYGGYADKAITSEKFPQLNKVISYPTLIFVDRDNRIKNIHTGFAGPATSEYPAFEAKFDALIAALRNQSKSI